MVVSIFIVVCEVTEGNVVGNEETAFFVTGTTVVLTGVDDSRLVCIFVVLGGQAIRVQIIRVFPPHVHLLQPSSALNWSPALYIRPL